MTRSSLLARSLSAALLGVWVAALAGGVSHSDDHGHRLCAEHGQIEETAPLSGDSDEAPGEERTDHRPCRLAATFPDPGVASVRAGAAEPSPQPPEIAHVHREEPHPAIPLLARAPKGSPPAR